MKNNPDYFHHILLIILGNKINNMLRDYGLVIRDYKEQLCKWCGRLKIKIKKLHQGLLGRNTIFELRNQKITKEHNFFYLSR